MKKEKIQIKNAKSKKFIFLGLIFFLAFILRVYKIAEYPAGLNADEAAIGYNVYTLLKTGKDEFGHPWPINFQSFNDYKPGLYFYLVLPFVKIFGLNELAVRLPSVILGALTVLVVYFLVKEIFAPELTRMNSRIGPNILPLSASLLLAISPWHLHFSRGGWETNVATFLITFGAYLFFKALRNPVFFIFSFSFFIFSMYTYHSTRLVTPILALGLIILNFKEIIKKKNLKWLGISFLVGLVFVIPLLVSFFSPGSRARFAGVGLLADQGPYWRAVELRSQHQNPYSFFLRFIHNKYFEYGYRFLDNYLRHFNGDFLFISGDEIQRNRVPEMGQMYLVEIPFLVLGLYFLMKNKPKNWQIILWWLFVAPIASALTFQSPHAIRSLNMVIPLVIISSYGLSEGFIVAKQKLSLRFFCLLFTVYCLLFFWNFTFYLHQYYIHYPQTYPAAWEYGFRELVEHVKNNENKYDKIYITNKYDQPYILFAFFLKYPPEQFQKEARLTPVDKYGFSTVENFGKYYFGPIDLTKTKGGMVIGSPEEIPDSATIFKRIYFKDGKTEAFRIVEM